jgi:hypothetical protein
MLEAVVEEPKNSTLCKIRSITVRYTFSIKLFSISVLARELIVEVYCCKSGQEGGVR